MKTFNIYTIGCQMNQSDSERLTAYLTSCALSAVSDPKEADVVVLVTCGIRQSAEDRIYGLIPQLKHDRPDGKIVLTGCLALRPDVRERLPQVDVWLAISDLPKLAALLELTALEVVGGSLDYLSLAANYDSPVSAFVPIGNGCNNFCSYCVVPYARGREVYRPHQEVIAEVANLVKRGYKEITLIAQNVNSYRSTADDGEVVDFADLLKAVDAIEGKWWLRFSTSHPKDLSEKLIKAVSEGQHTAQYFHVAVQSGDNEILRLMNRRYTAEHYLGLVKLIRQYSPQAVISTDIIVGYPSETVEQFARTKELLLEARFDMAYLAQYSPRPGTVSAKMTDDVPRPVKRQREQELNDALRQVGLSNNQLYIGQTMEVLIDELTVKRGQLWASGKSRDYKTIYFAADSTIKIGELYTTKIIAVQEFSLHGELVK